MNVKKIRFYVVIKVKDEVFIMKAAQITKYGEIEDIQLNEIGVPVMGHNEVLIKTKFAAVNPLDVMNITGSVKLIQNLAFPQTLGNEIVGEIVNLGDKVSNFKKGDIVYSRLPLDHIGGFAEYITVPTKSISNIPSNLTPKQATAIPLTGLTAYQGLLEELKVEPGKKLFIPGGSGSFGQIAVPIAKSLGLEVIVSGNARSKDYILSFGADQYIDYKSENYWDILGSIDYVIDTIGGKEVEREMSIMKPGGKLLSLVAGPNREFAKSHELPVWKQILFGLAGMKWDVLAKKYKVEYKFLFVREEGSQLQEIAKIIEVNNITPIIDDHVFTINEIKSALNLVKKGGMRGKVLITF